MNDPTFGGTWPFTPQYCTAAGFRQHYIDECVHVDKGAVEQGHREALVLLHGEPTWGYLYRHFIPPLAKHYRVVVPDHMGFGLSETPMDRTYTLKTHVENLEALIAELDLTDITLVGQDWGGPILGAYTLRNPDRVKRICMMNTMLGYGRAGPPPLTPWFQWISQHHEQGTLTGILGELSSTILSVMKIIGFENSSAINANWMAAYTAPFPNRNACIGAMEFPLDVHLQRIGSFVMDCLRNGDLDALKAKPAMLAFGLQDHAIDPGYAIKDFLALFPDAPVTTFPNAGHFCQEDIPESLVALIHQFIQTH